MPFRELQYQTRALGALDAYLEILREEKARYDETASFAAERPELRIPLPDFAADTWARVRASGLLPNSRAHVEYSPRQSGDGKPVPNITFKVPTGGGKTYLACAAISRIFGRFCASNTGFVLWIVPNEAIYTQTLRHLRNRQHPYRQALDRAAAGRVVVMEKGEPLNRADVEANLCIMVLMLQSSNRENQETLRLFRDRGDVRGFTPPEGAQEAHRELLGLVPNLSTYDLGEGGLPWPLIKDSVGNALRIIRPVVVMDEGHRAISDLAFKTLYDFNPAFVLELSATPKDVAGRSATSVRAAIPARRANVLVEISGRELEVEGMIKMPLNVVPMSGSDWTETLAASLKELTRLDTAARQYRSDGGFYIRPILLVQVERTGSEQRHAGFIHADDVKALLLASGLAESEVVLKTSEVNDLEKPENEDLLSPRCQVRAIITKAALAEGWDCPFAYVLCSLAASGNEGAMTQLVGRILRQPNGCRTGVVELDESYVFTHRAETASVVAAIKEGLMRDGLSDLVQDVVLSETGSTPRAARKLPRRDNFTTTDIALPQVLWLEDGNEPRLLDTETDLYPLIDWSTWPAEDHATTLPLNLEAAQPQIVRLRTGVTDAFLVESAAQVTELAAFNPAHAVRMLSEVVPNAYVCRELVQRFTDRLSERGFSPVKLGAVAGLIIDEMRSSLMRFRDEQAARIFEDRLAAGQIEFRLRGDEWDWIAPQHIWTTADEHAPQVPSASGGPLQRSLFLPVYASDLNHDETNVAVYLDAQSVIRWWHRNGTDRSSYSLRGWRRGNIYPDFVFSALAGKSPERIVALESKGDQLAGNLDTIYKTRLLEVLTAAFESHRSRAASWSSGRSRTDFEAAVVLFSEWKMKLPVLINGGNGTV